MLKRINEFLLVISAFIASHNAFAELEIEEIDLNHEDIPEIMPDLPQVPDAAPAVHQSGSFFSQYINEQNLIIAVVVLACIVVALLVAIISSKLQPSSPKPKKQKFKVDNNDEIGEFITGSSDIEGAVKSFLVRTNLMH